MDAAAATEAAAAGHSAVLSSASFDALPEASLRTLQKTGGAIPRASLDALTKSRSVAAAAATEAAAALNGTVLSGASLGKALANYS